MNRGFCFGMVLAMAVIRVAHGQLLPVASDLDSDAEQAAARGVPIIIMFSSDECPYCDLIARHYLGPLAADPATAGKAVIRMVKDDATPLVDFSGGRTNHAEFSDRQGVSLVPTLRFFSGAGERLAEDLVGVGVEDYYLAYVRQRLEQAHAAMLESGN